MEVQVTASQPLLAAQLQQQLGYRLHTAGFLQQLGSLLNELVGEEEYIEIPTLTISLNCTTDADFHTQFLQQLSAAIREQIANPQNNNIVLSNGVAYTSAMRLFFLKYGINGFQQGLDMLPALYSELKSLPEKAQPELEQMLKQAGKEDPVVWIRLYYLLGVAGIRKFFLRTFACKEETLQALIIQTLQRSGKLLSPAFATASVDNVAMQMPSTLLPAALLQDASLWQACFVQMLEGKQITASIAPATGIAKAAVLTTTAVTADADAQVSLATQLQNGLAVQNAGLVLLWMECGRLFRTLGYVADRQFVNEAAQQRAILLLHYICYGNTTAGGEEDWLLNKLLCAWPLHMPVDPELAPDEATQQAAATMLTAYLEAWRKDRKFSADWFSTAFLQREGQLSRRTDGAWILEVNTRTEDILINKVSMVKYAWMPQILYVQW